MIRSFVRPRNIASEMSFLTRILMPSLLLTALMFCGLSYCAVTAYKSVASASAHYARSADLQGTMVHLDEVLTMSANMAAATGDLSWEKRYRASEGKLNEAIEATMRHSPPSALQVRQLNEANLKLIGMENRVFEEVERGSKDRARAILQSPQYGLQKQIYATAISGYLGSAREEERASLESRKQQGVGFLLAGLAGFLGLSLTWIGAIRELRRWHGANIIEIEEKQLQLQAERKRYERMAANVPGMVFQFVLRPDGTSTMPFVSEGAHELYGIEPAAIRADSNLVLDAIIAEDRPILDESIVRSARELAPWQWEGRMETVDGTRKWLSGIARPERLANGDTSWDGVLLDNTQRKNYEADLERARREAEAANSAKSEFLSRMSHELRTPLNAILGFGQLLEVEELSQEQSQSVEQIMLAGEHLLSLINEVLDIARIESGQQEMQLERVDVTQMAREVCNMVRPLAQKNQIAIDLCFGDNCLHDCRDDSCFDGDWRAPAGEIPECVVADAQRFKQILLNLLSNAVKYAGVGATIRLRCQGAVTNLGAPMVNLSVSDNGPGIAPELQSRVWIPFDRLGAESTTIEGAGFGMPLSRELARAMGGELELQSVLGEGCTFVLALPCANAAHAAHAAHAEREYDDFARDALLHQERAAPDAIPSAA